MNKTDLPKIQYTVWPADPHGHRFQVKLHIANPDPGGQIVQMPAWIPGSYLIRDFSKHIETIEAFSTGSIKKKIALERIDNNQWLLPVVDGAVDILTTIYAFDNSVRAAYLDTERAFFNATSLCLAVKGQENIPCSLAIVSPEGAFADHWTVQTTLRSAKTDERGFGFYLAPNYDDLIDHPVAMGEFQIVRWKSNNTPHSMAVQGCIHPVDISRLSSDLQAICSSTINLFEPKTKRAPFTNYLFLVNAVLNGYGGLEHRNSTALLCRRDQIPQKNIPLDEASYREFLGLCSHEYFHTWNVKRIKPAVFAPYALEHETYTPLLWLFEGFTSYYDDLILLRSGVIDEAAYMKLLAKTVNGVMRGSGRLKQSVAESSFDAWTKYYRQDENATNAIVSYYTKGSLIALGLDLTIRSATSHAFSLDDVMRGLWEQCGRDFYQGAARGLKEKAFVRLVLDCTGVDISEQVARWVYGREDVPLRALFAQHGIDMHWNTANYLPTLDVRTRKQGDHVVLATVFEHGAAHQGGLSAHDVLVAIDGVRIDSVNGSLETILARHIPGERVKVHVFRRDELREFSVKLAAPARTQCQLKIMTAPL